MRLYVFVSEAVKLSDLVSIVETAKVSNAVHEITGVLSYSYGHYMQVLEGNDADVSSLLKNIRKDSRHQNITEILDLEIDERIFSDWSMNLVPLLKRNESFISFIDVLNNNIALLSRKQKRLMKIFHNIIDAKIPSAAEVNPFRPLSYSIIEWPNFDVVKPSSSLLSLCGTLMNNPTHFRNLVNQKMYGTEEEVRFMLNQLNQAGYLKVTQIQNLGQSHIPENKTDKNQDGYADKVYLSGQGQSRKARPRLAAG